MKTDNRLRITLSIILIALVVALVFFIGRLINMSQQPTDVQADLSPREVIISNLTGNSAVVSWYSEESIEGFINYGSETGQFTTKVLDFRDEVTPSARKLFYVKLSNLLPERKYYFEITAGTQQFNTPESTYSFVTLPSVDEIGVPSPILMSAPEDFVEGVTYMHASNGDNISTTASVYSTTPNMTIDKSTLKDRITGDTFDIGEGNLLIAITSSDGKRASAVISAEDPSLTIASISLSNAVYIADTIVIDDNPVSLPVEEPGDSAENPIVLDSCNSFCGEGKYCLCPSNCQNPVAVYRAETDPLVCGGDKATLPPTATPPSPTPTPTPAQVPVPVPVPVPTPVPVPIPVPVAQANLPSTDVNTDIALAINVLFGIVLVTLGYQLRKKQ